MGHVYHHYHYHYHGNDNGNNDTFTYNVIAGVMRGNLAVVVVYSGRGGNSDNGENESHI